MVKPIVWMRAVRDAVPKFTSARQHVLMMLALRMNPNGAGFASGATLADDAEVSRDTAKRATMDARKRGYLRQTRRGHRVSAEVVVASEWQLAVPVDNSAQPDPGDGSPVDNSTQSGTGAPLDTDPRWQSTRPKVAETPTQGGTGAPPRGPQQEVLSSSAPAALVKLVTAHTDATDDEAAAAINLIEKEKQPTNLGGLVRTLARDRELPDWVARVRAEQRRQAVDDAIRDGWRCRVCGNRNRVDASICRQCGTGRDDP